jgi:hypothetical protein
MGLQLSVSVSVSVSGCVALLGVASVVTGCAGQAPSQASLARLGINGVAGAALAQKLAANVAGDATRSPGAAVAAAQQVLATATPADLKALAALAQAVSADAVASNETPAGALAAPATAPQADAASAVAVAEASQNKQSEVALGPEGIKPAAPDASPAVGFMLGGLSEPVLPGDTEDEAARVFFHDGFDDGLTAWVSRGLGQAAAIAKPDTLVLAGTKARRSLWIKTRTEIYLAASAEPRLRLDFKGAPVALKAVWETDAGTFPEEILLAAVEPANDLPKDTAPEFDLSDLRGRPGHLVLVARAPKGADQAPVLDAVTIYDAQVSSR